MYYEQYNIEALRIYIFYLLSREKDEEALTEKLTNLKQHLRSMNLNNAEAYFNYSSLFARIYGRKPDILKKSKELIEKACQLRPENWKYTAEQAY